MSFLTNGIRPTHAARPSRAARLAALLGAMAIGGCSHGTPGPGAASTPSGEAASKAPAQTKFVALTQEEAVRRAHQVAGVSYGLWFRLDSAIEGPAAESFEGRTSISFELKRDARDFGPELSIDFAEGTLRSLSLNGVALDGGKDHYKDRYDGNRIRFKLSELKPGANRVEIGFLHPYSTNGNGLYRYRDPVDGRVYLYSNFEPYYANRMFPCFDQPDLKASYELTVETPADWQVVANTLERDATRSGGRKNWVFPPSPVFSTYLFALIAGPYSVWKADASGIPMRLLGRRSLAKYIDYREWFEITRAGLKFYDEKFGYPYPFSKFDEILVPDFNAGAMENVAAITFSERMIYRSKVTHETRLWRADTILHEMAHQWFGDLVTMKWWNGLWLNESFATFMSAWNLSSNSIHDKWPGAWEEFFREKAWAYEEDQWVTTHPIEVPVPDTETAESIFDGITYGKGAASLKQLYYFLGEKGFRAGLEGYFRKFAHKNTTLADFMGTLGQAAGKDLGPWQKQWLETPGLNTVKVKWDCDGTKLSSFTLLQGNAEFSPELREHRTEVALYRRETDPPYALKVSESFPVSYSAAETPVVEAVGKKCPDLVFVNYQDYDYVKTRLDDASLETVRNSLSSVDDPLVRLMLWHTLWQMVIDADMSPKGFGDIALKHLKDEKDIEILNFALGHLAIHSAERESVLKFVDPTQRGFLISSYESFLRRGLESSPPGSDRQLVWLGFFLEGIETPDSVAYARAILTGRRHLPGLKLEQERRWELISALTRAGAPDADRLIERELKADPTEIGQKSAISARTLLPSLASKTHWLSVFTKTGGQSATAQAGGPIPIARLRLAMKNMNIVGQEELARAIIDPYFEALPRIASTEDEEYYSSYTEQVYPSLCDPGVVLRTTDLIDKHPELPVSVIKALRVHRQQEERCIRIRQKYAG